MAFVVSNPVLQIDRIQNELLMKHYLAKKAYMDKQNPSSTQNERTLWHGTASNSSQSINQEGFNRGYCGKNGVCLSRSVSAKAVFVGRGGRVGEGR